jgi:hypothetical protein
MSYVEDEVREFAHLDIAVDAQAADGLAATSTYSSKATGVGRYTGCGEALLRLLHSFTVRAYLPIRPSAAADDFDGCSRLRSHSSSITGTATSCGR